ncbi:MAG: hypothetical protein Q9170_001474 [Blastenia crenularia]
MPSLEDHPVNGGTCLGITTKGVRCRNPPGKGKLFCHHHKNQAPSLARSQSRADARGPFVEQQQPKPKSERADIDLNRMMSQMKDVALEHAGTALGNARSGEQEGQTANLRGQSAPVSGMTGPPKRTNAEDYQVHVPPGTRKPVPSHIIIPSSAVEEFEEAVVQMLQVLLKLKECRGG